MGARYGKGLQYMRKALIGLAALGLVSLASAQCFDLVGPELLTNPGFESGDMTGWSYYEDYPYGAGPGHMTPQFPGDIDMLTPYEGDMYVQLQLGWYTGRGFIYQEVEVEPSKWYCVSGAIAENGTQGGCGYASLWVIQGAFVGPDGVDGSTTPAGDATALIHNIHSEWVYSELCVHAETDLLTICFVSQQYWGCGYMAGKLDGASIREQVVPEPGTCLLLGTGLIGLVGLARKR